LKVVLFIDNLNSGGAQRQIAMLSNYLHLNKDCKVEILTYFPGNHFPELTSNLGVQITTINKHHKLDFLLLFKLLNYINYNKVDVLCAFLFTPSLYGILIKLFSFRSILLIVSERSFERELNFLSKLTRHLYCFADFITANSQNQTQLLKAKYPNLEKRIFYINNGVDMNKFAPVQNQIFKCLSVTGIGRVEKLKNIHCLIEAIHILKLKYNLNLFVKWAGSTQIDFEYFNLCNKRLLEYNLKNNWSWLGVVKDVSKLINASEIVVHPSFGEGFPNTICEAMSSGSIVFASNILDHPLIIHENINGFLFDPNDSVELADKIFRYLMLTTEEKNIIRFNARESALKQFSFEKMGESYYNLFSNN
jgi:GalNAc-alpha-(1->4)-GalNAc-alpha-(1->3)-diNAcBac-PP-undecaprenol alpha-1,4-N-acetyl-D-galactosaminyltransferase